MLEKGTSESNNPNTETITMTNTLIENMKLLSLITITGLGTVVSPRQIEFIVNGNIETWILNEHGKWNAQNFGKVWEHACQQKNPDVPNVYDNAPLPLDRLIRLYVCM